MSDALFEVQHTVAGYMERIVKLFKPGVKIAVIVRSPGFPDRDFMMTDDSIQELRAVLDRQDPFKAKDAQQAGSPQATATENV